MALFLCLILYVNISKTSHVLNFALFFKERKRYHISKNRYHISKIEIAFHKKKHLSGNDGSSGCRAQETWRASTGIQWFLDAKPLYNKPFFVRLSKSKSLMHACPCLGWCTWQYWQSFSFVLFMWRIWEREKTYLIFIIPIIFSNFEGMSLSGWPAAAGATS